MAHFWSDNVLTTAYTPRDYQVELLASAYEKNIIICLGHNSSKEFIALKLIHEYGYEIRNNNEKCTIYLSEGTSAESAYTLINNLTDLKVVNLNEIDDDINWDSVIFDNQILICSINLCHDAIVCGYLELNKINLLVVDECHKNYGKYELIEILNEYQETQYKPKILGLAGPLHSAGCPLGQLGAELNYLEKLLHAKAETASDIVTVLRFVISKLLIM